MCVTVISQLYSEKLTMINRSVRVYLHIQEMHSASVQESMQTNSEVIDDCRSGITKH